MKKLLSIVIVTLLVCTTMLWIAQVGSDTVLTVKNKGYVNVKGFAKQKIASDLGIFKVRLSSKNVDIKLAYEKLAIDRKTVAAFFGKQGFGKSEIGSSPVQVSEKFKVNEKGYTTQAVDHVIVNQLFEVRSKDVYKIAKISADIGDLLGQGVDARAHAPQFIYTQLEELKVKMIGEATANATKRTGTLAKHGKFKVGKIADVRVGVFQITPEHSTEVSSWGINDTSSIRKEIKSIVEVKYFVR